jgi:hypothetical protein
MAGRNAGELAQGCHDDWTASDAAPWRDGSHLDSGRERSADGRKEHPLHREDYGSAADYADALFALMVFRQDVAAAETARAHLAAARQVVAISLDFGDADEEGSNAHALAQAFKTIDSILYGV